MKKLTQIFILLLVIGGFKVSAQTNEAIESKLVTRLENLDTWAYRTGTGDFDALEKENKLLKKELMLYGKRSSTLNYDFPALVGMMQIVTSKDRRLRTYSWDDQQGGTGRIHETVFQYRDKKGKTHTWTDNASREGVVCTGFVHEIFQVNTKSGRVYLLNSTSICSNPLQFQDLSLVRIDGTKLNQRVKLIKTSKGLTNSISFEYDFFSVVDHPERPIKLFFFDEAKKSFRFPVVVEDKVFINGGKVTDKFITYRFNGRYFTKSN